MPIYKIWDANNEKKNGRTIGLEKKNQHIYYVVFSFGNRVSFGQTASEVKPLERLVPHN